MTGAAAAKEISAVNTAMKTTVLDVTGKAADAAIMAVTEETVAMNARIRMTADAEMISVRSRALRQGRLPLTKAMCAAARNLKAVMTTDNKA